MRGSVPHPSLCQLFVRAWFQACTIASAVSTRQGSASSSPAPFGVLLLAKGTEHTLLRTEKLLFLFLFILIITSIIVICNTLTRIHGFNLGSRPRDRSSNSFASSHPRLPATCIHIHSFDLDSHPRLRPGFQGFGDVDLSCGGDQEVRD